MYLPTDLEKIKAYIDSFRFGAYPHGGGGIGKGVCLCVYNTVLDTHVCASDHSVCSCMHLCECACYRSCVYVFMFVCQCIGS